MSHFKANMHQIRFIATVRFSLYLFVCDLDGVWHYQSLDWYRLHWKPNNVDILLAVMSASEATCNNNSNK